MDATTIGLASIGVVGVLAMLAVYFLGKRATVEQLRLAYDCARSIATTLELVAPLTETTLDDRAKEVARLVEESLGRRLRKRERSTVRRAVMKAAASAGSLSIADLDG